MTIAARSNPSASTINACVEPQPLGALSTVGVALSATLALSIAFPVPPPPPHAPLDGSQAAVFGVDAPPEPLAVFPVPPPDPPEVEPVPDPVPEPPPPPEVGAPGFDD